MSETLLTQDDLCERLGVSRYSLYRMLPGLKADGLQEVRLSGRFSKPIVRYRATSLDKVIERAARSGHTIGATDESAAATAHS